MVSVPRLDSMSVTIKALFSSRLDPSMVKQVFLDKTLNASSHWLGATYQLMDVHVTGVRWGEGWVRGWKSLLCEDRASAGECREATEEKEEGCLEACIDDSWQCVIQ